MCPNNPDKAAFPHLVTPSATPAQAIVDSSVGHAMNSYGDNSLASLISSPNDQLASRSIEVSTIGKTDVDRRMLLVEAQRKAEQGEMKGDPKISFKCEVDGCHKEFRQRAHLHTHMRSHTGERLFFCPFKGCHKYFSQRCNFRTHVRSHTGERPYKCSFCGKAFSQQGNMRHHQLVHHNGHLLICMLGDCNKRFNQLENLKTHQNSAHRLIVQRLIARLEEGCKLTSFPENERKTFGYFYELYKNLNRGTRGRGKGTKTIAKSHRRQSSPVPYSNQLHCLPPTFPLTSYSYMDDLKFMSSAPPGSETNQSLLRWEELRREQDLVQGLQFKASQIGRIVNGERAFDVSSEQTGLSYDQADVPRIDTE